MDDLQLEELSVKELLVLKENVDAAIRAAIRRRTELKAAATGPIATAPVKVDLESERDAWMAARRQATVR